MGPMTLRSTAVGAWLLTVTLLGATTGAQDAAGTEPPSHTPPRLALLEGEVSFWRPSLGDWQKAPVNLPVAEGDVLATGSQSRAELQLRLGWYLRIGSQSELKLAEQTDSSYRFELGTGVLALDVRAALHGGRIEVAAGELEIRPLREGLYRVERRGEQVHVVTRLGGRALIARGPIERELPPDSKLVIDLAAPETLPVATAAPPSDDWDLWNLQRSAQLMKVRPQLASTELAGAQELDAYGEWRRVPAYGLVWFPRVPQLWVPYSTGRWIWDPVYGWTWVDFAPWGWVPFHYGRWVWVDSRWGWVLGPPGPRLVYAPALVAFFVGKGVLVGVAAGPPFVAWAPLGWGEPCIPWWGPTWFVGKPWWGGWHGPRRPVFDDRFKGGGRVPNVVNGDNFEHVRERRGLAGVRVDRFGLFPVTTARTERIEVERLALPERDMPRRPATTVLGDNQRYVFPSGRGAAHERPSLSEMERLRHPSKDEGRASTVGERERGLPRLPRRPVRSGDNAPSGPAQVSEKLPPFTQDRWGPFAPEFRRGERSRTVDRGDVPQANRLTPRPFVQDRGSLPRGVSHPDNFGGSMPVREFPGGRRVQSSDGITLPSFRTGYSDQAISGGRLPDRETRPRPQAYSIPRAQGLSDGQGFYNVRPRRPLLPETGFAQSRGGVGLSSGASDSSLPAPERRRILPFRGEERGIHRGR